MDVECARTTPEDENRGNDFNIGDINLDQTGTGGSEDSQVPVVAIVVPILIIALLLVVAIAIYFVVKNKREKSVSKVTILDESDRSELKKNNKPVVVDESETKPGTKHPGMWHGDFKKQQSEERELSSAGSTIRDQPEK